MSKIGIIIRREYLSRVTKKMFLLTTLGLPILMLGFSFLTGYLASSTAEKLNIAVVDESGIFVNNLWDSSSNKSFAYFNAGELNTIKNTFIDKKFDMLLHISNINQQVADSSTIKVYSDGSISSDANNYLEDRLNTVYQNKLMLDAGISRKSIDSFQQVSLHFVNETKDKKTANANIANAIGMLSGFLIYIIMFVYGMMVMRGVMEEKTNRIAEVVISSVKPFELMMGKVIGIALVGLTQFVIWIVFIGVLSTVLATVIPGFNPAPVMVNPSMAGAIPTEAIQATAMQEKMAEVLAMPWLKIGIYFLIYFMGGYLLYASLFAAVGSLVNEDVQEAQSLTLPITMPIIIGFIISIQAAKDPNSGLAVFGSIFPFTSPLVMMSRIAYNPPFWQIALSIALLIGTFIGTIWLSAKIYRTGILMYGKKITWREVGKWIVKK
jgi:ABC-2 type transport system permease protein